MNPPRHPDRRRRRFELGVAPPSDDLRRLLAHTSWAANRTEADIAARIQCTPLFVVARDGATTIGFGRALTDGTYRALLDDIVVAEDRRGRGIGAAIVESLLRELADVEEVVLNTEESLRGFYERLGFRPFTGLTMVRRNSTPTVSI